MRVLIISLLALLIAGCSFRQSHSEQEQAQYADMRLKKSAGKKAKSTSAASRVKLYLHRKNCWVNLSVTLVWFWVRIAVKRQTLHSPVFRQPVSKCCPGPEN